MSDPAATVFVSVHPFGDAAPGAIERLRAAGLRVMVNPLGRRLREAELAERLTGVDALVAGTEPITAAVIGGAPRLRLIARVGIGLDNVDLTAARARGITVTFTPDAPAPAVAELTCGVIFSLLRGIARADRTLRSGRWERLLGRRLGALTVGVIGVGRVGRRVIAHLSGFGCRLLVNDLMPDRSLDARAGLTWVEKERIYREADIITLHVPLTRATRQLVGAAEFRRMKTDALLINTSRGGVVDEGALVEALRHGRIGGAGLDVFEQEPYDGALTTFDNCVLTCHMGSMSRDCRARMEAESVEEVLRHARGEPPHRPVPPDYQ